MIGEAEHDTVAAGDLLVVRRRQIVSGEGAKANGYLAIASNH
jgi:hypothetical protein